MSYSADLLAMEHSFSKEVYWNNGCLENRQAKHGFSILPLLHLSYDLQLNIQKVVNQ